MCVDEFPDDPTDEEVDEALDDRDLLEAYFWADGETQWQTLGKTLAGRVLLVVEFERNGIRRFIAARDASPTELLHYRRSNEQRER